MTLFTAILQLALALLATAQSSPTAGVAAPVRNQAVTVASLAIRMADDAIAEQLRPAQTSAPDPARAALDNYLRTLIGRQATVADLLPLSTDATKASYLALGVPTFRDQTGVTVASVAKVASSTNEALFSVTTHNIDPSTTDTIPYDFLRSNGVWKYDLGESLLHFYGHPMYGAVTSLPVELPPPIATSTCGTPPNL